MPSKYFIDYLEKKYYALIFSNVSRYYHNNKDRIYIRSSATLHLQTARVENLRIERVYFYEKKQGKKHFFKLIIDAELFIGGTRDGDYEEDNYNLKFEAKCTGILDSGLTHFEIESIDEYSWTKGNYKKRLSASLIPYIEKTEFDARAEEFLSKYYPEALETPTQIDPFELARRMKVNVFEGRLGVHFFGKAFFRESTELVLNSKFEEEYKVIPKRSILVSHDNYFLRNIGSFNNTVVHECVHLEYHSTFFELLRFKDENVKTIDSIVGDVPEKYSKWYSGVYERMEYQANYLTPRILMPRKTFLLKYEEIKTVVLTTKEYELLGDAMSDIVEHLAEFFGVSKQSARIRLIELGITNAVGSDNFINNKKYPNYFFRLDLKPFETFVIDRVDLLITLKTNVEIKALFYEDILSYVNGMVVINSPITVKLNEVGEKMLTSHALNNIHRYALIFKKVGEYIKTVDKSLREAYINTLKFMSRSDGKSDYVPAEYDAKSQHNKNILLDAKKIKNEIGEVKDLLNKLNGKTIGDDLRTLFLWYGLTHDYSEDLNINKIKNHTGVDNHTIENYINNKTAIRKDKLIAICGGLKLPPKISFHLLKKAGFDIAGSVAEDDLLYFILLTQHYAVGIGQWNEIILQMGRSDITFTPVIIEFS